MSESEAKNMYLYLENAATERAQGWPRTLAIGLLGFGVIVINSP